MSEAKTPEQIYEELYGSKLAGPVIIRKAIMEAAVSTARAYASQLSPDQLVRERLEGMRQEIGSDQAKYEAAGEIDFARGIRYGYTRVLSLLSEAPPISKWVKVEDGLPQLTEPTYWYNDAGEREVWEGNNIATVLAYDVEHGTYKAILDRSGWTEVSSNSIRAAKPTYWHPLPTPPKD